MKFFATIFLALSVATAGVVALPVEDGALQKDVVAIDSNSTLPAVESTLDKRAVIQWPTRNIFCGNARKFFINVSSQTLVYRFGALDLN